ncbi:hypothetical protein LTR64_001713 [Lithohypha guttulata]|uniref:uncharacterized protein n=1 Tax=Lithohypha guttulata TaxID=1690604 RepID=UPI002DDE4853|nr:hypothetical protein LTR51_003907 [Lithohypha guttulata]
MACETHTAAVLEEIGQGLKLVSQPIPEPVYGSAVIRVLATPISPTTNRVITGKFPVGLNTPVMPSSSAVARVYAVGPDATLLKPGQLVFYDFCIRSRDDYDTSILQGYMGDNKTFEAAWTHGTFAQYACVPLERLWVLNEDLLVNKLKYTFAELAFLGTISIAVAGLIDIDTRPGDTVIVAPATGCFGGSAAHAAIAMGARVIACGRNEEILSKMTDTFKSSGRFKTVKMTGDVEIDTAAIKAAAGSEKGTDKYIDFSPPQSVGSKHILSCISAVRPFGNVSFMGAVFAEVGIPYFLLVKNSIRIQGRYMFERTHGEQAIKLVESGHMKLGAGDNSGMHIESFGLQDLGKALDQAEQHGKWAHMVVLEP